MFLLHDADVTPISCAAVCELLSSRSNVGVSQLRSFCLKSIVVIGGITDVLLLLMSAVSGCCFGL